MANHDADRYCYRSRVAEVCDFFKNHCLSIKQVLTCLLRYLLMAGKEEKAWKVISDLHADPSDPDNDYAKSEFYQMSHQATLDRTLNPSWKQLLTKPSYRKRVVLGTGTQQSSAISAPFLVSSLPRIFHHTVINSSSLRIHRPIHRHSRSQQLRPDLLQNSRLRHARPTNSRLWLDHRRYTCELSRCRGYGSLWTQAAYDLWNCGVLRLS